MHTLSIIYDPDLPSPPPSHKRQNVDSVKMVILPSQNDEMHRQFAQYCTICTLCAAVEVKVSFLLIVCCCCCSVYFIPIPFQRLEH